MVKRARPPDHATQVAAGAAVIRFALARAGEGGVTRVDAALSAFGTVEGWLRGDPVSNAALDRATQQAHTNGQMVGDEGSAQAKSASWACTAIGNLCWMARKERGWQGAAIVDAAAYTLTSLLELGDDQKENVRRQLAIFDDVKTVYAEALASAAAASSKIKAPARPRLRTVPDLEARVGRVAAAYMRRARARIDPTLRADEASLRARLSERGYRAHAAVIAFEARWGGMVMARGTEGNDWVFGAFACAPGGERGGATNAARALVPVAHSPNDVVYFLDARGRAWGQDTIEEVAAVPRARDGDALVAQLVLFEIIWAERMKRRITELEGARGARLARRLGLPRIAHASDDRCRFWGDGRTLVAELRSPDPRTIVVGVGWRRAG